MISEEIPNLGIAHTFTLSEYVKINQNREDKECWGFVDDNPQQLPTFSEPYIPEDDKLMSIVELYGLKEIKNIIEIKNNIE